MKKTILICTLAAVVVACGQKQETKVAASTPQNGASATAALPPGHPAVDNTTAAPPAALVAEAPKAASMTVADVNKFSGTVQEVLKTKDFLYLRVNSGAGDQWAVVRPVKVAKGDRVTILVSMNASKFEAKSLHRTFDTIAFGEVEGGTPLNAAGAAPHGGAMPGASAPTASNPHAGMPGMAGMASSGAAAEHMKGGAADVGDVKVDKASGSDAKTVAEIWAGRATTHENQPVVVRGKVVKFMSGIMGKNWIHLRDGSGSKEAGDNDITVTTNDTAKVGSVVVVSGALHLNKDFGAGYSYPVIIEDAKVK